MVSLSESGNITGISKIGWPRMVCSSDRVQNSTE